MTEVHLFFSKMGTFLKRLDNDKPEPPGKFVYKCSGWISLEVQRKHKNQISGFYSAFTWLFSSKMFSAGFFNTLIITCMMSS